MRFFSPFSARWFLFSTLLGLLSAHALAQVGGEERRSEFSLARNRGYEYEDRNWLDSAGIWYERALHLARTDYDLTTIYTDLAILNRKRGLYSVCKDFHEKALEVAQRTDDREMVADNLHGIGYLYEQTSQYDQAADFYLKSLKLTEEMGDWEGCIATLQNIAKTYMRLNYRELTLQNIEKAQKLAAQIQNDSVMANVLQDYGEVLLQFGDNAAALDKLSEALKTYERINYERYIGSSLVYIGDVYAMLGDTVAGFDHFRRAFKHQKAMDSDVVADLYFKHGTLLRRSHRIEDARRSFEQGLRVAQQGGHKNLQQKCAFCLYEIAKNAGDAQAAQAYLKMSSDLKGAVFGEEMSKNAAEQHFKFEVEQQQNEMNSLKIRQQEIFMFGTLVIFALAIGFLIYIIVLHARNNRQLELKNREIQDQNALLKESNEVLRQYAYVAAHDLKEPLRTICSFINLLEMRYGKKLSDPQAIEFMQFISNSTKRMNLLLTDLLNFSSIFNQKPGTDIINPKQILDEVCINLQSRIESKNGAVEYPSNFPSLCINRVHLTQILQNLVANGLKFTPDDRPARVQIQWRWEGSDLLVSVRDNGIGISKGDQANVFKLFFRADNTKDYEGTGIGLSVCRSLVEKYGGNISFQSVEGQGTTFFLAFPADIIVREETQRSERRA